MEKLEVTFRVVTPLFLGGAEPDDTAELRVPSIKGVLRFWFRTFYHDYSTREASIFGGSGKNEGQSVFLLKIGRAWEDGSKITPEKKEWSNKPGLRYFAFPFTMNHSRRYIPADKEFKLSLIFKKTPDIEVRKSILATLWLFGHLGGVGSRSRRGFGTVAVTSWPDNSSAGNWPEIKELPIAHNNDTIDDWITDFKKGMACLNKWFPQKPLPDHAVLNNNARFLFLNASGSDCLRALEIAAQKMQSFRTRRDTSNLNSDYHRVKAHICRHDQKAAKKGASLSPPVNPEYLIDTVDRAAFGLPLKFQYSSLEHTQKKDPNGQLLYRNGKPINYPVFTLFQGEKSQRSASRLHIRVIKIKEKYYSLFFCLDGPLLAPSERLHDKWGSYSIPSSDILNEFLDTLTNNGQEVNIHA